jgi:hypothetical protein
MNPYRVAGLRDLRDVLPEDMKEKICHHLSKNFTVDFETQHEDTSDVNQFVCAYVPVNIHWIFTCLRRDLYSSEELEITLSRDAIPGSCLFQRNPDVNEAECCARMHHAQTWSSISMIRCVPAPYEFKTLEFVRKTSDGREETFRAPGWARWSSHRFSEESSKFLKVLGLQCETLKSWRSELDGIQEYSI